MARADLLHQLKYRNLDLSKFDFELIKGPPVLSLLSPYDVQLIDDISRDPRLVTKLDQRLEYNDKIMQSRGFVRTTQGTNRAVYKYLEDQSFVFKIAISDPGRKDSPAEFYNQHKLKPFVAKCFDVAPSGVIGSFERVEDITSKEQFKNIAGEVFDMINKVVGQYVMADIGTKFFRNYGIRLGFGPVWLDYPLLYEVEGSKLFCNSMKFGMPCGGAIDYDPGFNFLYCEKCGQQYTAKSLSKAIKEHTIEVISNRRKAKMKIEIFEGNEKVSEKNLNVQSSDTFVRNKRTEKFKQRRAERSKELHVKQDQQEMESSKMDSIEAEPADEISVGNFTVDNVTEEDNNEAEIRADENTENADTNTGYGDNESSEGDEDSTESPEVENEISESDDVPPQLQEVNNDGREDGGVSDESPEDEGTDPGLRGSEDGMQADQEGHSTAKEGSENGISDSSEDERKEYIDSLTPEDYIQDLENIKELCTSLEEAFNENVAPPALEYQQQFFILNDIVKNLQDKYNIIKDKKMAKASMVTEPISLDSSTDPRDINSPEELAQKMSNY